MGKLLIFRAAVDAGLVGLVIVGVLTSAVGAYYYLRVVVYMYMRPAPRGRRAARAELRHRAGARAEHLGGGGARRAPRHHRHLALSRGAVFLGR
jgi:NADH:ubiquinone oxidoreductase subunit 2 (subunit N)